MLLLLSLASSVLNEKPFLEALSLDSARIPFQKHIFQYQVQIAKEVSQIRVFATPIDDVKITISMNGQHYSRKDPIPLAFGENIITISSATGEYSLKLVRSRPKASAYPSYLSQILIDGIPISDFKSNVYDYKIVVPSSKSTVSIEPIPFHSSLKTSIQSNKGDILDQTQKQYLVRKESTFQVIVGYERVYKLTFVKTEYSNNNNEPYHIDTSKPLTPPETNDPNINCPKIYGARPGTPFFFYIATSGAEPMHYEASNLPQGLTLNSDTGIITGTTPAKGTYEVSLRVHNSYGATSSTLKIMSGDLVAITPPMGWNSWYVLGDGINSERIRTMTKKLIEHNIHKYGYAYVNIDDCWQGPREATAPYALTPKKKYWIDDVEHDGFSDIEELVNFIHSSGLKAGIYSGPKMSTFAGFLGASSNEINGMDETVFSPHNENPKSKGPKFDETGHGYGNDGINGVYQPSQYFGANWPGYAKSIGAKPGKYWFGTADTAKWAEWGIDYVKWDWHMDENETYTVQVIKQAHEDIIATKRDLILSLSNTLPTRREMIQKARDLGANLARLARDIYDAFTSILAQTAKVIPIIDMMLPGFWADLDMLQIGFFNGHQTNLNHNEQFFQISYWAMVPAPMLLTCDLTKLDNFTKSLIINPEVNRINQDSLGIATSIIEKGKKSILVRRLDDGTVACGTFVMDMDDKGTLAVNFEEVSEKTGVDFSKGAKVRSVWERKDIGIFEKEFVVDLEQHQGFLFNLSPVK